MCCINLLHLLHMYTEKADQLGESNETMEDMEWLNLEETHWNICWEEHSESPIKINWRRS